MAVATRPDIPRAKRAGLDLDLAAVCAAGPGALQPDDHYRLKTYGVCSQRQDDLFMIRMRVAGGTLTRDQVRAVAAASEAYAHGWVHLTTRQNIELHSVRLEDVPALYAQLAPAGVIGRSACGHTIRNVMACPESATSVDEPFDVAPDAVRLSTLLVERSEALNVTLPSRLNIVLGGCHDCGLDAKVNDIGLVATVRDGVAGYQLWAGGSLGTAPRLSMLLRAFITRDEVWPTVWSIVEWFSAHGDLDTIAKGRLKFVIEQQGDAAFRQAFAKRFAVLTTEPQPPLPAVVVPDEPAIEEVLAMAPSLGWRAGVRPQRERGLATLTVRVPLGDLHAAELLAIAEASPEGAIHLTRDQNIVLRSVPLGELPRVNGVLADMHLGPHGAKGTADVRACPGLAFCSLAITGSQPVALAVEHALGNRPDLPRETWIAVSGCPNSCARQQIADIGLAGGKVKVGGRVGLGYQLCLGADVGAGLLGEPVLKLREEEVPEAVVAILETWVGLRRSAEPMGATFRRIGLGRVAMAIASRLRPDEDRLVLEGVA